VHLTIICLVIIQHDCKSLIYVIKHFIQTMLSSSRLTPY